MSVYAQAPLDVDMPVRTPVAVRHLAVVRTAVTAVGTVRAGSAAGATARSWTARRAIRLRALAAPGAPLVSTRSGAAGAVWDGASSRGHRRRTSPSEPARTPTATPTPTGPALRRKPAATYGRVVDKRFALSGKHAGDRSATAAARAVDGDAALADCATPSVRLTRRGHLTLVAGAASIGAAVIVGSWWSQPSAPPAAAHDGSVSVVVSNGDSLWSIAARVAPARDPRAEVSDLLHLNRLSSPDLVPGQVIRTR